MVCKNKNVCLNIFDMTAIFFLSTDHSGGVAPQQMEKPSMSAGRKIALALSIVNCVAFIILFLWILPCEYDTCKATHSVKTKDWEVNLTGKGILNNCAWFSLK